MPFYYSLSHNRITEFYQSEAVRKSKPNWINSYGVVSNIESLAAQEHLLNGGSPVKSKPSGKSKGKLSKHSKRRIISKVNWLALNSKERNVKLNNGHVIKNFKISIITLTLPTKLKHTGKELTRKGLNQFLTTMRKKFGFNNYVWKAELQENGNIHYHICADKVIHYRIIRKYWNAILSKLGYISAYQRKFALMSKEYYINYNISRYGGDRETWGRRYHYGVSTGWKDPNTTDVKSVTSADKVAAYISKYLSKDLSKNKKAKAKIKDVIQEMGRFWSCSHSLSKLGNVRLCVDDNTRAIFNYLKKMSDIHIFQNDFVECLMFGRLKLPAKLIHWIYGHLVFFADLSGYKFPGGLPWDAKYACYDSQVEYQKMVFS